MDRRDFIKNSCLTCAASVGAMWFIQACTTNKYATNFSVSQKNIAVKKTEFTTVKKGKTLQQKFILIKPANFQFPIALYKVKDNAYKALLLQCTHQGCELSAYETTMVCPCHGAEFNTAGEVTQGPAETNLKTFITTEDNDNVYIHI